MNAMIVAMSIPLARIAVSDRILHVLESDTLRHFSRTPVPCRPLTSPLFFYRFMHGLGIQPWVGVGPLVPLRGPLGRTLVNW